MCAPYECGGCGSKHNVICEAHSLLLDYLDVFVMTNCTLFTRIAGSSSNRIVHAGCW
jgi:hypothetical protein